MDYDEILPLHEHKCQCFANECPDWPLSFFTHGIIRPCISLISLILSVASLKTLTTFRKWHRGRRKKYQEDDFKFINLEQQKLATFVRIILRTILCHCLLGCAEFLKPKAGIVNYPQDLTSSILLCYLSLFIFNFAYQTNRTFLEIYSCGGMCEIIISKLVQLKKRDKKINLIPKTSICGTQFFIGLCCIFATVLTLMSIINYDCDLCYSLTWKQFFYEISVDFERWENSSFSWISQIHALISGFNNIFLILSAIFSGFIWFYLVIENEIFEKGTIFLIVAAPSTFFFLGLHDIVHHSADLRILFTDYTSACFTTTADPDRKCYLDEFIFYCEQLSIVLSNIAFIQCLKIKMA